MTFVELAKQGVFFLVLFDVAEVLLSLLMRSMTLHQEVKEIVSNKYNGSGSRVYRYELSIISVSGRCKVG